MELTQTSMTRHTTNNRLTRQLFGLWELRLQNLEKSEGWLFCAGLMDDIKFQRGRGLSQRHSLNKIL
jgi:hypothetical protein